MPNDAFTYHNILLIQLRRIGDVMMTTPSIRALRHKYPDARITFITETPSDQVLKHNPYLNDILIFPRKASLWKTLQFYRKIRQQNYNLVIDFFGNPRSAFMSWMTGAPKRIGMNFKGRQFYYTNHVDIGEGRQYSALHKLMLLEPLGIRESSIDLDFFIGDEYRQNADALFKQMGLKDDDFIVSLSPVSRRRYKVWPPQHFGSIANQLIEKFNAKIIMIYGPGEKHFVEDVHRHVKNKECFEYEASSLLETRAFFEKVQLHIGNDNGPRHIAISSGTPTVAVFGQGRAVSWTPPNQDRHQTVEYDPGCKSQCTYPKCEHLSCINGVEPGQVEKKIYQLIEKQNLRT